MNFIQRKLNDAKRFIKDKDTLDLLEDIVNSIRSNPIAIAK